MRIRYLDGYRLYYAVLVGGNSIIEDQNYLNKINVFPVHGPRRQSQPDERILS